MCVCVCVCVCARPRIGAFEDEDIIHVEGSVDPVRDMEIIHEELRLKDQEAMDPILDKLEKMAVRGGDKKLKPEYVRTALPSVHYTTHSHLIGQKLQLESTFHYICTRHFIVVSCLLSDRKLKLVLQNTPCESCRTS